MSNKATCLSVDKVVSLAVERSIRFPKNPPKKSIPWKRSLRMPKIAAALVKASPKNSQPASHSPKLHLLDSACEALAQSAEFAAKVGGGEQHLHALLKALKEKETTFAFDGRCKVWRFKEREIAQKKLQTLHTASLSTQMHSFTSISLVEEQREEDGEDKDAENWEELIRNHEERHFHLTRIVKMLTK